MLGRLFNVSGTGTGKKVPSSFDACCGNRVKKDVKGHTPNGAQHDLVDSLDGSNATESARTAEQFSGRPDELPFSKVKRLQSYEEANQKIIKEETDPVSSEAESDKEELRHLGKQLQNQSKKTRAFFKREAEADDEHGVEYSALAASMKSSLNHLKEEFTEKPAAQHQGSVARFGSSYSLSRATASIATSVSQRSATSKVSMGKSTTTTSSMSHAASEEEEDDPDEDEDDPIVLDKIYKKEILKLDKHDRPIEDKAQHSMNKGIGHLRLKMECQGIEEPPSESDEEIDTNKPIVLELGFQMRTEDDQAMQTKIYTFRKRPLGIKWEKRLPITISDVAEDGYAGLELGVKETWKVVSINGADCRTFKHYPQAHKALMDAVKRLPLEIPPTKQKGPPRGLLDHVCSACIGSAKGFGPDDYDKEYLCVCEIPGKPHSKVKTHLRKVADDRDESGDIRLVQWDEEFELFDFALHDNIEFSVIEKNPSEKNPDEGEILIGRAEISYHSFSSMLDQEARRNNQSKGFELNLIDPYSLKVSKVSLKVRIRMDLIPEKDHNINTYCTLMRKKLQALGVPQEEIDASMKNSRGSDGVAGIVKAGVLAYHTHSESIGRIYPFPGKSHDDSAGMDEDDLSKIKEYTKRLDTSDPTRLWPTTSSLKEDIARSKSKRVHYEVKIQFRKNPAVDAEVEEVTFEYKPIGIMFSDKAPIKIAKVKEGGEAARKDVRPGWIIKSVNSKLCEGLPFVEASKILNSELEKLESRPVND